MERSAAFNRSVRPMDWLYENKRWNRSTATRTYLFMFDMGCCNLIRTNCSQWRDWNIHENSFKFELTTKSTSYSKYFGPDHMFICTPYTSMFGLKTANQMTNCSLIIGKLMQINKLNEKIIIENAKKNTEKKSKHIEICIIWLRDKQAKQIRPQECERANEWKAVRSTH